MAALEGMPGSRAMHQDSATPTVPRILSRPMICQWFASCCRVVFCFSTVTANMFMIGRDTLILMEDVAGSIVEAGWKLVCSAPSNSW